ncbi:receptor-type tyrosine-protein kinase FLT3 isoform X2 [Folsomia candida]|uniref:receptor-type tyrosine-protein kinase FLT3 isoform X2 n=1 Tax=Folsomia candida TaxID=158441 RepID=UPI001604B755|nr:receptor-type tyrosine-protein kinase FLT3 isoform X2 [Folsomia candida]
MTLILIIITIMYDKSSAITLSWLSHSLCDDSRITISIMGLNYKNLILQPCMGLFLRGAVKAAAVVEGVSLVMIIMATVDYANHLEIVWSKKDSNVSQFCGYMLSWIFCYFYRLVTIGLAIRLLMIVSKRDRKALKWWLVQSAFLYIIWFCCFIINAHHGLFYTRVSFVTLILLAIYKLYFFWTVVSFNIEIGRNGSIDPALRVLSDEDLDDFFSSNQANRHQRYNKTFEISFNDLAFDTNPPLGSGAFGIVYKASLTRRHVDSVSTQIVALKTVLPSPDVTFLKSLLRELQVLNFIGSHENIVNLVGACTSEVKRRKLYFVMEYCAYGSIKSYLRKNREAFINKEACDLINRDYISWESPKTITIQDLITWAFETANGMEYIAGKHAIHGDISSRNVLLNLMRTAKVADFGLSRQLYRYTTFTKHENECLPIRGEICPTAFIQRLKNGEIKPDQPTLMTNEIYEELCKCWVMNPKSRPSFTELKLFFAKQILRSISNTDVLPRATARIDPNMTAQPYLIVGDAAIHI